PCDLPLLSVSSGSSESDCNTRAPTSSTKSRSLRRDCPEWSSRSCWNQRATSAARPDEICRKCPEIAFPPPRRASWSRVSTTSSHWLRSGSRWLFLPCGGGGVSITVRSRRAFWESSPMASPESKRDPTKWYCCGTLLLDIFDIEPPPVKI